MSTNYSAAGKVRLQVYAGLFLVNIVVLALSARVNQFQGFFFVADLFPLGLSIASLVLMAVLLLLDFSLKNVFTARPPFEIGFLSVLTVFWLGSNVFSTSRWRHVPLMCSTIPAEFSDEKTWCKDLQALKAFVWLEWAIFLLALAFTIRYVAAQHVRGNTHVWRTALSRYTPAPTDGDYTRWSSFWDERGSRHYERAR